MIRVTLTGSVSSRVVDCMERGVIALARRAGVRHAILGVMPGNGSFQWIGTLGEADLSGIPMTPNTPYFLASVTKLYIGAVILRLGEKGQLSLDDPITKYLPPDWVTGLHRYRGVDYSRVLTLRHLLTHTSGLREYLTAVPKGNRPLLKRLLKEGDQQWDTSEMIRIVRSAADSHFPPCRFDGQRQKARYSDTNFQLLLAIIRKVTDVSLHEAFSAFLFKPLGLRHTGFPETVTGVGTLPFAVPWVGRQPAIWPKALRSFHDLYSTAEDTLRFLHALITGELFGNPQTVRLMCQLWNPLGFSFSPTGPGWPIEYGLAMMRFRFPRFVSWLYPCPALIGHSGATGSWLFYIPDCDLYLTGTVDQLSAAAVPFRILPHFARRLGKLLQTENGVPTVSTGPASPHAVKRWD